MSDTKESVRKVTAKLPFLLAVVLLFVLSFFLLERIDNMRSAADLVSHSNIVRLRLETVLSELREAESSQRDFLLTDDSVYYFSKQDAYNKVHTNLNLLNSLVADNPLQQRRSDTLSTLAGKRIEVLEKILDLRQKNVNNNILLDSIRRGRVIMADVKRLTGQMADEELKLLGEREMQKAKHFFFTPFYTWILIVFSLLFLTVSYFSLRRQLRLSKIYLYQSQKTQEALRKTNTLFHHAEEVAAIGSWKWNYQKNEQSYSDNLYRLLGYPPGHFRPTPEDFGAFVGEVGWKELQQKMEKARNNGHPATSEYWSTREGGQQRYFRIASAYKKNEKGENICVGTVQDITSEHLLKQQIKERSHFIELVIENNVDLISAFDNQLIITLWNKACEERYDIRKEEAIGKKLTDVLPFLKNETAKLELFDAALGGKKIIRKVLPSSRGERLAEFSFIPLQDAGNKPQGILVIIHDITDIRQAADRLKEANNLFENAEQVAGLGSWHWNTSTNKVTWSKNLFRVLGFEPDEFDPSFEKLLNIVHAGDRKFMLLDLKKSVETGEINPVQFRVERNDGTVGYMKGLGRSTHNEKGERILSGTTQDVTELALAMDQLKRSETFNRLIGDVAPIAIYVLDLTSLNIIYSNIQVLKILGYSHEEMCELNSNLLKELLHPDDMPAFTEQHKRLEAGDTDVVEYEYRVRNKAGIYQHFYAREAVFKRNENGTVEQLIGVAVDITELKKAQQQQIQLNKQLEESNLELKQSNEELASFNYIASHDLQEPLRKIQTFSNMLESKEKLLSEDGKVFLKRVQVAAERMRTLIHDLLSFSRVNMTEEKLQPVDLNLVLERSMSTYKIAIEEKAAVIRAGRLPSVLGTAFQLQQLFENLINNALKYSRSGVPSVLSITSELVAEKSLPSEEPGTYRYFWCLTFRDNGIGFEQEYAQKIFELFQRLHTRDEYAGTGIGLAICKKIVQKHGGHIQARGNPGEGAAFKVYLPAE